jgi:hypothetical protein
MGRWCFVSVGSFRRFPGIMVDIYKKGRKMRARTLKKKIIALLGVGDLAGVLALQEKYPNYQL